MMHICESLRTIRPTGKVVCDVFHGSQVLPRKVRIRKCHYHAIPDELWSPISGADAQRLVLKSICYHVEDNETILDEDLVSPLVDELFNSFADDVSFFTNDDCISHSIYDVAVIAENANGVVGLVCIEDDQQP